MKAFVALVAALSLLWVSVSSAAEGQKTVPVPDGGVAEVVGIEGGVVSGVINLESPGVRAPGRRPRHEQP